MTTSLDYCTYDPEDDKIRVYFASRRPDEDLAPLKEAGFGWAGKRECWYAVWSPAREDAAFAAAGVEAHEDEPTTLMERAEERSERFEDYAGNAAKEAAQRDAKVQALAECMNGQPILVGHHSEKRHRRDYARMWDSMGKASQARKRAGYWGTRSAASVQWARYKDKPGVRARRIKTLEAEARKVGRSLDLVAKNLAEFRDDAPLVELYVLANDGTRGLPYETWATLRKIVDKELPETGLPALVSSVRASQERRLPSLTRWAEHLAGRIAYERNQLAEQGCTALLDPKPRRAGKSAFPMRNQAGGSPMTKAEFARINKDHKGSRVKEDAAGKYRVRTAIVRGALCEVTLTDAPVYQVDA